ncbi:hypothetical protein M430DRAFT_226003 [Amorphotheca resinae ATCC 22711]|jgi:hypothetical protein|uniref:Uncharacterized protein n=1 Tax=Amorphotheca resinae ATCC 22711 TaxID=857342 RepID=A0A2T3B6V5_AMORE|nr:hypothetical protein M430DRAFT_226003 [Amorphotheca resinae ATCC 22711]PSS22472.1 hypothetical protein M430DRAFT_226003 [Amorphotheca resinae ATCC 22711]
MVPCRTLSIYICPAPLAVAEGSSLLEIYSDKEHTLNVYIPKLEPFLLVLEDQEQEHFRRSLPRLQRGPSLSELMRRSMTDMPFLSNKAARNSYALNRIHWSRLDSFCFGPVRDRAERSDYFCHADVNEDLNSFLDRKVEHLC